MKMSEIQEMTPKELRARKHEMRQEVFNLRIQQQSGQLERPHMLKDLRRDLARIETVLTKKQATPAAETAS